MGYIDLSAAGGDITTIETGVTDVYMDQIDNYASSEMKYVYSLTMCG